MSRRTQIAVIGAGLGDPELTEFASEAGRLLAEAGAIVVCGGRGGVMEAVAKAALEAGGETIGIIPEDDPRAANPYCTHVVASGVGHARNLAVVASSDAVIAIGGAWGTLSEMALARKLGRPVIALRSWEPTGPERADGIEPVTTAAAAVERALALAGR